MKNIFFISLTIITFNSFSQSIDIVSWNLKEIFSEEDISNRSTDFQSFGDDLSPDILLLQEYTDGSLMEGIGNAMGLTDYFHASSNFVTGGTGRHGSFETGVLSKYPISRVIEFDISTNGGLGDAEEIEMVETIKGYTSNSGTGRGFLWVEIECLNLVVIPVHLKSSVGRTGNDDKENAFKRERVAIAIANFVSQAKILYPHYTFIVAGDFNVGHADSKKNGTKLDEDCYEDCSDSDDGYDDTHAIFEAGIVNGLTMKNLLKWTDATTYERDFGSGPIDNIFVDGDDKENFSQGVISDKLYNSDHFPIYTTLKY
ncbi:MAG: endonuclease/exonuclease/phosphatase family protein [Chitinophagales bacterium]